MPAWPAMGHGAAVQAAHDAARALGLSAYQHVHACGTRLGGALYESPFLHMCRTTVVLLSSCRFM